MVTMKLSEARDFWRSRGVPEEALDDLWDLAEAARYNDARAEEQSGSDMNGLVAFLRDRGWHEEAVTYIAEQRALRVELVAGGGEAALREFARTMEPGVVRGSSPATQLHLMMADGFANGLVATELKGEEAMRLREFTVTGKGEFPLDMLRYDQCYPKREGKDVRAVYESVRGFRRHSMAASQPWEVTLVTVKDSAPTVGRWESFGWGVLR